jgi:hypothetical protein
MCAESWLDPLVVQTQQVMMFSYFFKKRKKESSVINAGVVGGFSIITHTKKYPRKIQE